MRGLVLVWLGFSTRCKIGEDVLYQILPQKQQKFVNAFFDKCILCKTKQSVLAFLWRQILSYLMRSFLGFIICVIWPFCSDSFFSCSLVFHYKISKYQWFSSNCFQVKLLCSGERFLINLGMYWANFTLPLRRPQKSCFSAISCPHTSGWSQVPRLLKIGFFFFFWLICI